MKNILGLIFVLLVFLISGRETQSQENKGVSVTILPSWYLDKRSDSRCANYATKDDPKLIGISGYHSLGKDSWQNDWIDYYYEDGVFYFLSSSTVNTFQRKMSNPLVYSNQRKQYSDPITTFEGKPPISLRITVESYSHEYRFIICDKHE